VVRIEISEQATLRSPTGKKLTKVFASRPNIAKVEADKDDPTIVRVTGMGVGTVEITLVEETGAATKITVRVLPDMSYIRETIRRHFPRTNLTIERVGEATVVITGDVELAEQISGIIQLVESMVGKGYAINNMRLAGVVQVQLEICVAQVRRSEARRFGFNWFQSDTNALTGSTVGGLVPQPITGPAVTSNQVPPGFLTGQGNFGTLPPAANFIFGIFDENSAFFGFLDALRQENLAKIMAHPTLTTLSGRPATFTVGGEEPYGTAGSGGGTGTGIEFKPFGTYVRFLPIVLGNGKLRIEVQPEVSTVTGQITQANIVAPRLDVTRVETTVEIESGQTMVIGGLLQNRVTGITNKVPVLGDLPFVGTAFRTVSYNEDEVELLVIVTPHVIDPLDCYQRPSRLPGQETRTPTDFELFLEGILEAPRGQRELCPDGHYKPAHYWAPPHCYPYGTPKPGCNNGACTTGCYGTPCVTGGCATGGYVVKDGRPGMNVVEVNRPATIIQAGAEQPQIQQGVHSVVSPQQPVAPAVYVPESNQPQTEQAPMPVVPASHPIMRLGADGGLTPVQNEQAQPVSPPVKTAEPMPVDSKDATPVSTSPSDPVKPMDR
jgi:pilus assembly protein CpaC